MSILSLLSLLAAFDTTDHSILITRLCATCGCSGTVLDCFIFCLSCYTQSVFVGHESAPQPQGSVLGPLLFTLHTLLNTIICQSGLSCHFLAESSQLHNSSVCSDFRYKIACLCFLCVYQNSVPPYLFAFLIHTIPSRMLRCLDTSLLSVPCFFLETFGKDLSLFLDPLSRTPYCYPSVK